MQERYTKSKWFQGREPAETNLNETAGFRAAVLIGFRYSSREGRHPGRRPFIRLGADLSPGALGS
jgi:hypothetical protein